MASAAASCRLMSITSRSKWRSRSKKISQPYDIAEGYELNNGMFPEIETLHIHIGGEDVKKWAHVCPIWGEPPDIPIMVRRIIVGANGLHVKWSQSDLYADFAKRRDFFHPRISRSSTW
jgi:hypothetical protein